MRVITRCSGSMLLAALLACSSAGAATLRCDNGVVDVGDTVFSVVEKCGEPAALTRSPSAVDLHADVVPGRVTVERWESGPRLGMTYRLEFHDGRLVQLNRESVAP